MPTSNLIVSSASLDLLSMEMTCWVNPGPKLYIYELVIEAIVGLGAPMGTVRPGPPPPGLPVARTIYVDASDPVFEARAPFILAVTYDDVTYRVRAISVLQAAAPALFNPAAMSGLTPEQTALFVAEVLAAATAAVDPPEAALADHVAVVKEAAKAFHDRARRPTRNGHGEHEQGLSVNGQAE